MLTEWTVIDHFSSFRSSISSSGSRGPGERGSELFIVLTDVFNTCNDEKGKNKNKKVKND